MTRIHLLVATALLWPGLAVASPSKAPSPRSTGQIESTMAAPSTRSTGQVESTVEALVPLPAPIPLTFPKEKPIVLQQGKVSAAHPQLFEFETIPHQRIEIRLQSPAQVAWMSVLLDSSDKPVVGTGPGTGCIGWISTTAGGGKMRVAVYAPSTDETPFRLAMRMTPEKKD